MNVTVRGRTRHFRTVTFDAERNAVLLIEQRLLPHEFRIVSTSDFRETARAIQDMIVRGAGAIGAWATTEEPGVTVTYWPPRSATISPDWMVTRWPGTSAVNGAGWFSTTSTVFCVTRYMRPSSRMTTLDCGSMRTTVPDSIDWAEATLTAPSSSAAATNPMPVRMCSSPSGRGNTARPQER